MKKIITSIIFIIPFIFTSSSLANIVDEKIPFDELNQSRFEADGLIGQLLGGGDEPTAGILNLAIVFGGLILFVMIIISGFTMMTNPQNPQAQEAGKQRLTWSVVGFLILFSSYWIVQIIEAIFGLNILGQPAQSSTPTAPVNYDVCRNNMCFKYNGSACMCISGSECNTVYEGIAISCCNGQFSRTASCP